MLKPINIAEVRFEIRDEIGLEGQNSKVFKAYDPQLNATLAIKKIQKQHFCDVTEYFNEASLLYLSSHPNIVPIHYACQDESYIYLAMPHYANGSLKAQITNQYLSVREIINYATQVLSGLHNIHSKRLVHFDIKPDNILLSPRGEALLADFGLAKQTSYSGLAGQDRCYGKMVPPEAFNASDHTFLFDIYQMGLTLHRMCKGDKSFYDEYNTFLDDNGDLDRARFRHAVVNAQFPKRGDYPEHIPQKLIGVIRNCLEIEPQNRFQSAIEIVNALSDIDGKLLDWKYFQNQSERSWEKLVDNTLLQLKIEEAGSSVATKTTASGVRRISSYCLSNISRQHIKSFLRDY